MPLVSIPPPATASRGVRSPTPRTKLLGSPDTACPLPSKTRSLLTCDRAVRFGRSAVDADVLCSSTLSSTSHPRAPTTLRSPAARETRIVPPPVEIPAKLTLDDALTTFRARGFQLLIAEAAVMSAEGDEKIAGAVPNPGLNVGYGRVLQLRPMRRMQSPGACLLDRASRTTRPSKTASRESEASG